MRISQSKIKSQFYEKESKELKSLSSALPNQGVIVEPTLSNNIFATIKITEPN
jgi:hypothetical protein